jgi:hypothetical protein
VCVGVEKEDDQGEKVTVEKATRDELLTLSESVRTSATAEVALHLARRLDSEPALFASLDGARILGGCDHCDAYQEPWIDALGICHINIRHDDRCPFLQSVEAKRGSAV